MAYTWGNLLDLNSSKKAYLSPLSAVAHIDVNAFYAQVEQIRCGYTKDDPVICVQWKGIIAVSYAARSYGIKRLHSLAEAKQLCPNVIPLHTAVYKKGENVWRYVDYVPQQSTHKVSLEPYRRESRKILKIFQKHCDLVEKASVDEVFLDLGRVIFQRVLEAFPVIKERFLNGEYELEEPLPSFENCSLKWNGPLFGSEDEQEVGFQDWDDIIYCITAQITQEIRDDIQAQLGYTTSCGIARTKSLAKLASNFKKPDAQTIVRNSKIREFVSKGEITTFWTMGGSKGKEVVSLLNLPERGSNEYMLDFSQEQLSLSLGDEKLAQKLYQLLRGEWREPVNSKPMVKSMIASKNIRNNEGKNIVVCIAWIKTFVGELAGRLLELNQEYDRYFKPKTVTMMFHSNSGLIHRRQMPFTGQVWVDQVTLEKKLFEDGVKLMKDLDSQFKDKGMYPIWNLMMGFGTLEEVEKTYDLMAFVKKAEPATWFTESTDKSPHVEPSPTATTVGPCVPEVNEKLCVKCGKEVDDMVEHSDWHYAIELSEGLNGKASDSMSIGEQRLTKRRKPEPKPAGVLKFFSSREK